MDKGQEVVDSREEVKTADISGRLYGDKDQHLAINNMLEWKESTCVQFIASFCFEKPLDIEVDLVEVGSNKVYSTTEVRVKWYRRCRSGHDAV